MLLGDKGWSQQERGVKNFPVSYPMDISALGINLLWFRVYIEGD